jgi:hypothetical protein
MHPQPEPERAAPSRCFSSVWTTPCQPRQQHVVPSLRLSPHAARIARLARTSVMRCACRRKRGVRLHGAGRNSLGRNKDAPASDAVLPFTSLLCFKVGLHVTSRTRTALGGTASHALRKYGPQGRSPSGPAPPHYMHNAALLCARMCCIMSRHGAWRYLWRRPLPPPCDATAEL